MPELQLPAPFALAYVRRWARWRPNPFHEARKAARRRARYHAKRRTSTWLPIAILAPLWRLFRA